MRRKLKNFKNKNGHSENGSPRTLVELAVYREHNNVVVNPVSSPTNHYDSEYSGWSNAARPRDQAISLRAPTPLPDR